MNPENSNFTFQRQSPDAYVRESSRRHGPFGILTGSQDYYSVLDAFALGDVDLNTVKGVIQFERRVAELLLPMLTNDQLIDYIGACSLLPNEELEELMRSGCVTSSLAFNALVKDREAKLAELISRKNQG